MLTDLLPVLSTDETGETTYACPLCRTTWSADSLARLCAARCDALRTHFPVSR